MICEYNFKTFKMLQAQLEITLTLACVIQLDCDWKKYMLWRMQNVFKGKKNKILDVRKMCSSISPDFHLT